MKKPSAAKPPEEVFFVDRSLGRIDVPNALRDAGFRYETHDSHFKHETEDAVWLRAVAAHGWIVLTKDERIRYRPMELRAFESARLRVFIMICGNVRGLETAAILLRAMPRILSVLREREGPFIYYIYRNAKLKRAR